MKSTQNLTKKIRKKLTQMKRRCRTCKQYTTFVLELAYIIFEQPRLALMPRKTEFAGPSIANERKLRSTWILFHR